MLAVENELSHGKWHEATGSGHNKLMICIWHGKCSRNNINSLELSLYKVKTPDISKQTIRRQKCEYWNVHSIAMKTIIFLLFFISIWCKWRWTIYKPFAAISLKWYHMTFPDGSYTGCLEAPKTSNFCNSEKVCGKMGSESERSTYTPSHGSVTVARYICTNFRP